MSLTGDLMKQPTRSSDRFYLQTTEVTVGQWSEFIKASSYKTDSETSGNGPWIWIGHKWEQDLCLQPGKKPDSSRPVTRLSYAFHGRMPINSLHKQIQKRRKISSSDRGRMGIFSKGWNKG